MCHSSSSVFMTNKSPSGAKSTTKAKNPKVAKWPKCPLSFFSWDLIELTAVLHLGMWHKSGWTGSLVLAWNLSTEKRERGRWSLVQLYKDHYASCLLSYCAEYDSMVRPWRIMLKCDSSMEVLRHQAQIF